MSEKIDQYYREYPPAKYRKVLVATFSFTRAEILDILKVPHVIVAGKFYETPEAQLYELLLNGKSGLIELELIEIEQSEESANG